MFVIIESEQEEPVYYYVECECNRECDTCILRFGCFTSRAGEVTIIDTAMFDYCNKLHEKCRTSTTFDEDRFDKAVIAELHRRNVKIINW